MATKYKQMFDEMVGKYEKEFDAFQEIHDKYEENPREWQAKFNEEGAVLISSTVQSKNVSLNFLRTPDLAQSVLVMAAVTNTPLELSGIQTLKVKETDRIEAMRTELKKINSVLEDVGTDIYHLEPDFKIVNNIFETYKDHRMAMAFSLIGLRFGGVTIENPACVSKTFPNYFEVLEMLR